jgi:hypothetical protein
MSFWCSEWAMCWNILDSISSRDMTFQNVQTPTEVHPASYSLTTRQSFRMEKVDGAAFDSLLPPSFEIKHEWSCSSTPFMPSWLQQGPNYLYFSASKS